MRGRRRLSVVVAAMLVFGACAGDGDGDGDDDEDVPAASATTRKGDNSTTSTTDVPMLGIGAIDAGTYQAELGAKTARVTLGPGWGASARADSFDLYRGGRNTATELLSFASIPGSSATTFLDKARADGSAEVTNEAPAELGGMPAKRYDLRIRQGRLRIELFETSAGVYELVFGHQATVWLADGGDTLFLAIAEGKDDTIEAFRPLATSVVESLELA